MGTAPGFSCPRGASPVASARYSPSHSVCGRSMFWRRTTFNGSIWHAFWVLSRLGIVVFLVCFFSLTKGSHYFFDPKHNADIRLKEERGDYEPHSKRYQELAKLAITLSTAAIASSCRRRATLSRRSSSRGQKPELTHLSRCRKCTNIRES
jgi:hypothetical protein